MNRRECKALYVQDNSVRKPGFRVSTELCEDESGVCIRKRAEESASRKHLESIYANALALRLPCVKGVTLAEQIDTQPFEKERFIAQTNEKLTEALSVRDQYRVPFAGSDAFDAVFGKVGLDDAPALNPANVGSLLSDFIVDEAGIYCQNCEWLFRFPVPIDFIRFRLLLYLYIEKIHSELNAVSLEEMLGWFGYSEQACALYWEMERCFRQHILGEGDEKSGAGFCAHEGDARVDDLEKQITALKNQNAALQQQVRDKQAQIRKQGARIQELTIDYNTIKAAFFWRITKPARATLDAAKRIISKNETVSSA